MKASTRTALGAAKMSAGLTNAQAAQGKETIAGSRPHFYFVGPALPGRGGVGEHLSRSPYPGALTVLSVAVELALG